MTTPALRHVADPWVPWQWWGMPDGAAERAHAVESAATQEPDRWEWIVLGGQNVVALYLAGFRDEATARRWGEQHGWTERTIDRISQDAANDLGVGSGK